MAVLKFENDDGNIVTYSLEKHDEPIDSAGVTVAMDTIIAENAFTTIGGNSFA